MNSPNSGLGTQVGGYQGHGDANWAAQVSESLAEVQIDHIEQTCGPPSPFFWSLKKHLNFQSVLKVQPGRRRTEHAKDWSIENTRRIDWGRLNSFLKKHAKALEGYIGETFQ